MAAALPLEAEADLSWLSAERGRSTRGLTAYRRALAAYVAWLAGGGGTVPTATTGDIEHYAGQLRADGRAAAAVKRSVVAVRSMHGFLAVDGQVDHDPAHDVAVPRVPAALPKALTEVEIERLLGAV